MSTAQVQVYVTLHGDIRRIRPKAAPDREATLVRGTTVAELLAALPLKPNETLVIAVNNEVVTTGATLHDGDEVLLSSPMEGG